MRISAWILIFFACISFCLTGYKVYLVFTHPLKFKEEIVFCSKEFDLSPELIASVINVESSFNKNAKSNKNAIGLMQIKLTTANYLNELNNQETINETELFSPTINIKYGSQYLKYLIDKFENIDTALASYNAGETRVRSWLNSGVYSPDQKTLMYIPYEETRNYVEKINENLKYYSKIFN